VISPKRKRTVQNRHPDFFAKVLNVQMVPQDKSAQRERVREREGKKEREKKRGKKERETHTHSCSETAYRIIDVECIVRAKTLQLNLTGLS